MEALDFQAKFTDTNHLISLLSSEGIDFLVSNEGKVPISSCDGKRICLFFSANWCRPCKAFTPQLVQLYNTLRLGGQELEIVFISFDHDDTKFKDHLKRMPWLAVPFDALLLARLSKKYKVDRIPCLVPLSSDGVSIEDDLIGLIEDYGAESFPFTRERREELKTIDKAKRQGGKLEEVLSHPGRNYVVSRDSTQTLVSELVGKTVGLYFGAHWSPPCRAFTAKLAEAYNTLRSTNTQEQSSFEVILVSTDRDQHEFGLNMSNMPWLAIPYGDRTRQDLCRIFDIKAIPALVLIGPDGKSVSTNGKSAVSLYGAKAFPFTESKVRELESGLRKEGEALAPQVKDVKHEHVLKLDMAKGFVCDFCKEKGRFWAFTCDVCDYDLHPNCVENDSS